MGIEKEIKQSYFRNDFHKVLVNIIFTSNYVQEQIRQYLEAQGITHQQYNILRILRSSNMPLSTLQIREQMIDKMSDTSRIVERLLKKEFVNKQVSKLDKRLVDITITNKGLELLEKLDKQNNVIDSIPSSLTNEELTTLNNLLDKIRDKA